MSEAVENRCGFVTPPVTDGPMKILSAEVGKRIPSSLRCGVLPVTLSQLFASSIPNSHWRSICCGKGEQSGGSRLLSGSCLGLWELRREQSPTQNQGASVWVPLTSYLTLSQSLALLGPHPSSPTPSHWPQYAQSSPPSGPLTTRPSNTSNAHSQSLLTLLPSPLTYPPCPVYKFQQALNTLPQPLGAPCGQSRGRERVWGFMHLLSLPPYFPFPFSLSHSFEFNICKKTPICCKTEVPCDVCEGLGITNMFKHQECFNQCYLGRITLHQFLQQIRMYLLLYASFTRESRNE